ncbi:MAG: ABC transporter permease [Planctomycetota bacterium]
MFAYIVRRLLWCIPIILGVCLITTLLLDVAASPEARARRELGGKNVSEKQIQAYIEQMGYDRPVLERMYDTMKSLLTFQFKDSIKRHQPVSEILRNGAVPSLCITVPAFFVGLLLSISVALFVAYYRATPIDVGGVFLCVIGMCIPMLFYIIVGQYFMSKEWNYAPAYGYVRGLSVARFVMLPIVIAVISGLGGSVRFYRTIVLDEMYQDYVRTARAKGVGERRVLFRHVLRNSMIPILTSVIVHIPFLVIGSLLLEDFFGIPGLGNVMVRAVHEFDTNVIQAVVFLASIIYVVALLITDITYAIVDPRIRLG